MLAHWGILFIGAEIITQPSLTILKSNPREFVLNFCDTGFKNEAILELKVVAYLDMLEIPYSGSGPVCLGLCYDKALVRALAGYSYSDLLRMILEASQKRVAATFANSS